MNIKSFFILITLLCFCSCEKKVEQLENEKLAQIVADLHISEIALKRHIEVDKDSLQSIYIEKLEYIHKVSSEEIKREVEALMDDPKRQSAVYTMVIAILQETERNLKNKKDTEIKTVKK